jgi:D-3-phosphoglycerate dehydrogenase
MAENTDRYKVVAQKLPASKLADYGADYVMERKALDMIGAKIIEVDASSEEEFIEAAKDADAIVGIGRQITRNIIQSLTKCRIIAVPAVGFDNVDVAAATQKGIVVVNVPDTFIEEVADHTMTLLLACWRRLVTQDRMVRTGLWNSGRPMLNQFSRLMGQTLGFIAFGNIPRAVSRRARPFGLHMAAYDPYISELIMSDYGVEPMTELSELLKRSDFVSVHLPLSPETHKMISEQQFRQMKPTAIFINTGRGQTVDEHALIKALRESWIAFAGLDVLEKEPIEPDNPLLKMENVILTAHVGSASSRMRPESRRRIGLEIARVLQGQQPVFPVNPQALAMAIRG